MRSRSGGGCDPMVAAEVLGACARLHDLGECWQPAGSLVEDARLLLAGCGGLDGSQMNRLRAWSLRWSMVNPRLRELYLRNASAGAVDAALWHVLEQRDGQASGSVYGTLRDLWLGMYGYAPSIELIPRINLEDKP